MKKIYIISSILLTSAIVLGGILNKKETLEQVSDNKNIALAIYLNDRETNVIPEKEGNIYDETRSSCTNGAYIIWDYESWSPIVKNMSEYKTRCELYFKTGYKESI